MRRHPQVGMRENKLQSEGRETKSEHLLISVIPFPYLDGRLLDVHHIVLFIIIPRRPTMFSQRPQGQSKILISCGFGQSMSTTNLARMICGLPFVLRFVTFSKRSNLRIDIRSKVVELLDQRNIQHSSVDLVCVSWVEEDEEDEDIDIKVAPNGTVVTTPVTIWVGVLPDTLTGKVTFKSSNGILDLLKEHGISDVDVAYRESVARGETSCQSKVNELLYTLLCLSYFCFVKQKKWMHPASASLKTKNHTPPSLVDFAPDFVRAHQFACVLHPLLMDGDICPTVVHAISSGPLALREGYHVPNQVVCMQTHQAGLHPQVTGR